jgi:hypothetical protein
MKNAKDCNSSLEDCKKGKKSAQCWEYVETFMSREAAYKENTAL